MPVKIRVTYTNGTTEVFMGLVKVLQSTGCFQISKELGKQESALLAVEEKTDSVYIPFTSVLKLETLNSES